MSGPLLLPTWEQLADAKPHLVATMRRYLQQIACVLRPGSVTGADLALRSFAGFLVDCVPEAMSTADVVRRHVEEYKPWLAARPGQNRPRVTDARIAHRLGTLRMFFVRIDEWGWPRRRPGCRCSTATYRDWTIRCPKPWMTPRPPGCYAPRKRNHGCWCG